MNHGYQTGSLVRFRGREWVVESIDEDLLKLRPLSGFSRDLCGAFLPLESDNIEPAGFPLPTPTDLGDFGSVASA